MSEQSDEHLVAEARNGDSSAFKALVERHEGKVAGVVKSMLGDSTEAADVGQEVFIRFYEALEKFRGESSVGTYLIRIAINLSLNEIRKRNRRGLFFRRMEKRDEGRAGHEALDLKEVLNYEIGRLDAEFRAVVTLRLIEGYSTEETAEILETPLGTVLSRLSRAQKKLKAVLVKHLER